MSDRIVVMSKGRIDQVGTPDEIYAQPATPFVADFVGKMNFLTGRLSRPDRADLQGAMLQFDRPVALEPGARGHRVPAAGGRAGARRRRRRPQRARRDRRGHGVHRQPLRHDAACAGHAASASRPTSPSTTCAISASRPAGRSASRCRRSGCASSPKAARCEARALTVAAEPLDRARRGRAPRRRVRQTHVARRYAARAACCSLLIGWLVVTVALPLYALLSKAFQAADGSFVGLANFLAYFGNPALSASIWNSADDRHRQHGHLRRARLRLRLCADAHDDARPRHVPARRAAAAARALAAAGDRPRLSLRQQGPGEAADVRRVDLRPDRHRHRRGLLDLSARADHPDDGARAVGRAALRGGGGAARPARRASS